MAEDSVHESSLRASPPARMIMLVGLVSVLVFWAVLLLDDDVIFPFITARVPSVVLIGAAAAHVLSAIPAWLVAAVRAAKSHATRRLLVAVVAVPVTALLTFGVMLSDALVWRGDFWSWLAPAIFAAAGPAALAALLMWSLAAERSSLP